MGYYNRFNMMMSSYDPDALRLIVAAGITDPTQKDAINYWVVANKSNGLWGKKIAAWLMVGATAAAHRYNAKDPRTVNAAYYLDFFGGWTHSSTGAKPNGTTAYADTFLVPSTALPSGDSLGYYSRTNSATDADYMMGVQNSGNTGTLGLIGKRNAVLGNNGRGAYFSDKTGNVNRAAIQDDPSRDSRGFFSGSQNGTNVVYYKNGVQLAADTMVQGVLTQPNNPIVIGGLLFSNVTVGNFTDKECAGAEVCVPLTAAEHLINAQIWQTFNTMLGRQV